MEKKLKAQLTQTPGPKTETDRKTDRNRNKPKPMVFQVFRSVSGETFKNRKFRFRLARLKKTDRTEPITALVEVE